MPSPTPPHRPHDPAGRPVRPFLPEVPPPAVHPALPARRPAACRPVDLLARIGTAITLIAMMVVVGSAFAMADDVPVPTGATAGR